MSAAVAARRPACALLGVGLLLVAAVFPLAHVAATMPDLQPELAAQGLRLLRWVCGTLGIATLGLAAVPAQWFRHPGLPRPATGLRLGPQGWLTAATPGAWGWLALIVLIGTLLRVYHLNSGLWIDEVTTVVQHMREGLWQNMYQYANANQHVLNSILGHFSIRLFGEHAWSVRLPALLFGIGGLWALYYFARIVTTEREALLATALLAVSYHHVWFSQNARGYTAMLFWSLLGSALLLRALARNRSRDWLLYVAAMALGLWSLLNTAFVLAGQLPAYLLLLWRWQPGWGKHAAITRRLLASQLFIGLLVLVMYSLALPSMVAYFGAVESATSSQHWFSLGPALLDGMTAGLGVFGLVAAALALGLVVIGWCSYLRQSPLVAAMVLLPAVFNGVAVQVLHFPAFPRSFLYVLPFGILLLIRGTYVSSLWVTLRATAVGPRRQMLETVLPLAIIGAMLAVSTVSLWHNYQYPKQDYLGALAYARERADKSESVCAIGRATAVYREYYAPNLCILSSLEELEAMQRDGRGVWVIYTFRRIMRLTSPRLADYLQHRLEPVATFPGTLGDGDIYLARAPGT